MADEEQSPPLAPEVTGPESDAAEVRAQKKRAADAARKRRSRARLNQGVRMARVAVPAEAALLLQDAGYLSANDADNDDAVAEAVVAFMRSRLASV